MSRKQCEEPACDKVGNVRVKMHNKAIGNSFWYWACTDHFEHFVGADHLRIVKHRKVESINE